MQATTINIEQVRVVDDHAVLRDGINLMLTSLAPGVMVHEASTAAQSIDLARHLTDLDLVLLDLSLSGGSQGLQTVGTLCGLLDDVPVIILSADEKTSTVRKSIQQGARDYLPKSSPQSVMHNAIRLVLGGGIYVPHTTLDTTGELESTYQYNIESDNDSELINDRLTKRR